jgi:6-pyruvoyl-tetrahydropterin synthase
MDYFLLKQDERYTNTPRLMELFNKMDVRNINLLNAHKIEDIIVFKIKVDEKSEFLDVLDNQLFLISKGMKEIIEKYDSGILFKTLALIDQLNNKQENYYLPIVEELEVLSDASELNLSKTVVKKIILNKEKIQGKKIFKIKESSKTLIVVRLDVAESLLRRNFKGIKLERLEVEEY